MAHRTLVDTYFFVKEKLDAQETISIRKQMCLTYLTWGHTTERSEKEKFVELAKEFRVKEARVGQTRTLLEKKARRLFKPIRKRNNMARTREAASQWCVESQEKKIGVFSEEYQANLAAHNKRIRQIQIENNTGPGTCDWIITSPTGEIFRIRNLCRFCRENPEHALDHAHLCRTGKYPGRHHKGWKARKYCPDFENL